MYVNVANGGCIGCAACAGLVPEVFQMTSAGVAQAIDDPVPEEYIEKVEKAAKMCPKDVIFLEDDK